MKPDPLITNDAIVLGILLAILAFVFYTAGLRNSRWQKLYKYVPTVLLCYFIPAILNTFNIISGDRSQLYAVASRYFLPACLILLTLGVDIAQLKRLGPKSLIMFFVGTLGIIIGGPIALALVGSIFPQSLMYGDEEVWRGLATLAGSWIGGGANQAAMLEVFGASKSLFGQTIAVDILVANLWLGILLFGAQHNQRINRWLKADNSAIVELEKKMEQVHLQTRQPQTGKREWLMLLGISLGLTGLAHFGAELVVPLFTTYWPDSEKYSLTSGFFWIVILATTFGLLLSFTRARKLEAYGASELGSVFIYFLVTTIGMSMDLKAVLDNPLMFLIGTIWIIIHISIMIVVARLIRAPFFFVAVGSEANIGGAASAPIIASAFSKFLTPVGVLLAVLGYAVGTYGAYVCGLIMQAVTNWLR